MAGGALLSIELNQQITDLLLRESLAHLNLDNPLCQPFCRPLNPKLSPDYASAGRCSSLQHPQSLRNAIRGSSRNLCGRESPLKLADSQFYKRPTLLLLHLHVSRRSKAHACMLTRKSTGKRPIQRFATILPDLLNENTVKLEYPRESDHPAKTHLQNAISYNLLLAVSLLPSCISKAMQIIP